MSTFTSPSTYTSTPHSIETSTSTPQYFTSNQEHQRGRPDSSSTSPGITLPPSLDSHRPSSSLASQRMVYLDDREHDRQGSSNNGGGGGGAGGSSRGGGQVGGGGATFLSDEETNASEVETATRPGLQHATSSSTSLVGSQQQQQQQQYGGGTSIKGKGKAIEQSSTAGGSAGAGTTKTKKGKGKAIGPDGKPIGGGVREKKKKAGRACAACQKAHLTCDDGRPCARCIKKGCPEDCVDGARKKAKYLQEIPDELLERGRHPHGEGGTPTFSSAPLLESPQAAARPSQSPNPPHRSLPPPTVSAPPPTVSQPMFDFSQATVSSTPLQTTSAAPTFHYDPNSFLNFSTTSGGLDQTQFGSEAANLEYAILSSMLNGNGFALDAHTPNLSGGIGGGGMTSFDPRFVTDHHHQHHSQGRPEGHDPMLLGGSGGQTNGETPAGEGFGFEEGAKRDDDGLFNTTTEHDRGYDSSRAPKANEAAGGGGSGVPGLMTAEESLRSVTKPYPYAQSYHYLVKHLKERFEKNDILRIIRALATFRPSLIALQMPLTEEDETFVERTFQRTLVELNKLISFSGTPTVVWRRTGEICLVGTEFCLLTGWKREELVGNGNVNGLATGGGGRAGGGRYIFELFDTASVVEYYESFAKHAFESTSTSVTLQCVVLGPDGRPVPCAFCFSVRRDLFSCPFLIIGSFLPILV